MNETTSGLGGWGIVILIAIFFLLFGGLGNNNATRVGEQYATQADIQRAVDLNSLQEGQNRVENELTRDIKDSSYNTLSELRDLQAVTERGFSGMQKMGFDTIRAIDTVNYNNAVNTNEIKSAIHAEGEATRDLLQQQEMQRLRDDLAKERATNSNYEQSMYLLGQMGRWHGYPACSGCCGSN